MRAAVSSVICRFLRARPIWSAARRIAGRCTCSMLSIQSQSCLASSVPSDGPRPRCRFCGAAAAYSCTAPVRHGRAVLPAEIRRGDRFPLWVPGVVNLVRAVDVSGDDQETITVHGSMLPPVIVCRPLLMVLVGRLFACGAACCDAHVRDGGDDVAYYCSEHWYRESWAHVESG